MPNKLSQFWRELKRRNVARVLAVYIAAAFMILELISMFSEQIGLPDGTWKMAFFISLAGLVIAVIISWIYDIDPEGGMVKTEPSTDVSEEITRPSFKGWKIASYISFVVIVALIVLNIVPRATNNRKVLEKSIAVLPLDYLSEDPDKEYLANGVLDAITGYLSTIDGLRVMPRTSVEQYRESKKSAKSIGEELDVSYLIEGSFLMVKQRVKLTIQLVVAGEGDHIFIKEYDRDYNDIFAVQSEVAQTIAKEIEVVISPEEKVRIEKIPTSNLTAYDFYQRGREEQWKYSSKLYKVNPAPLKKAGELYRRALEYDSSFAQAYAGLADVLLETYTHFETLNQAIRDSALFMADQALSIDHQISLAHSVRGRYYLLRGDRGKALQEFDLALQLNPNDYQIYISQGYIYWAYDITSLLDNYHKAASFLSGKALAEVLNILSYMYSNSGFEKKGIYYAREALMLGGDSATYYAILAFHETMLGNFAIATKYYDRMLSFNTNDLHNLMLKANYHCLIGQYEESIDCYEKLFGQIGISSAHDMRNIHRFGLALWNTGEKAKAQKYFDWRIAYADSVIIQGVPGSIIEYYDLAATYAFMGRKKEALEYLRLYHKNVNIPILMLTVWLKEQDPLFNGIRDDPEFQQIVRDVEAKYQAEHERVRQWLEENDMI